jgi:hypothetical protein
MLFPEYLTEADLPKEGAVFEVPNCDFKTWYRPDERHKLVTDIVAFANALGGVLLVGAKEENERLIAYAPRTRAAADELRAMANEIAQKSCVPCPRIDARVLPQGLGYVVAIHVYGSTAQPIGARVKNEPNAYRFPIRRVTGTEFLEPQELATIMVPAIRARALQLAHIPTEERAMNIVWHGHGGAAVVHRSYKLVGIDDHLLQARFIYQDGQHQPRELHLPLDQIVAVESRHEGSTRTWYVTINGVLGTSFGGIYYWERGRS